MFSKNSSCRFFLENHKIYFDDVHIWAVTSLHFTTESIRFWSSGKLQAITNIVLLAYLILLIILLLILIKALVFLRVSVKMDPEYRLKSNGDEIHPRGTTFLMDISAGILLYTLTCDV